MSALLLPLIIVATLLVILSGIWVTIALIDAIWHVDRRAQDARRSEFRAGRRRHRQEHRVTSHLSWHSPAARRYNSFSCDLKVRRFKEASMTSFLASKSVRYALLSLAFLACAGASFAASGQCSVTVADPRCEYLKDPLGIDVRQPRLSWRLEAVDPEARGQRQTAYQVLVASTKALLEDGKGDLWDSGMVSSDQSVHVVYAGKPLASGIECFWKVRVKDEKGGTCPAWSTPAPLDDGPAGEVRLVGQVDRQRSGLQAGRGLSAAGQQGARPLAAKDVRAQGQARAGGDLRGLRRLSRAVRQRQADRRRRAVARP